jgi:CubicO group peptidase (beta-lactamase class C family)
MVTVEGTCDEGFESVRQAFTGSLETGSDVGASVAVVVDGQFVVDVWGGTAKPETGEPWRRDTVVNVFSTTKTMMALVALILADRGEVDMNKPVAHYWSEFAA